MYYRREIDGLRALAVVPVILFHGGFSVFSGGFVGVDVFFVISGYLITSIILADLKIGKFSLVRFYERRARRILPALLFVMVATIPFAYEWMMPDEFKNFGQSLLATAIFSNNILLALTSDYWSLASEFKPLLHTWSLGVEEQYYVIFPVLMILGWRYFKSRIVLVLGVIFTVSLIAATWGIAKAPVATFYLLPTRAWEILLGALVAYYHTHNNVGVLSPARNQTLSLIGVILIVVSVLAFNENYPSPGLTTLVPAFGTVLIILFALEGTVVRRLLGSHVMVGTGLISYSLYLWHQPLFAMARVYSIEAPQAGVFGILIGLSFALAYLTWRFVEMPFRNRAIVQRRTVAFVSVFGSLSAIIIGYYLNTTYGMAWRIFDPQTSIQELDKRFYNERVFQFRKDKFSSQGKVRLLVVGNSFGRDFVNMTTETFNVKDIEIVYRDDLSECIFPYKNALSEALFGSADLIVFATDGGYRKDCITVDIRFVQAHGKNIFYIGTKSFGRNLNWILRLPSDQRRNQYNLLPEALVAGDHRMSLDVPAENFVSLLAPTEKDGRIPITDDLGRVLSTDRVHVTKFGAIFFGQRVLVGSRYGAILEAASRKQNPSADNRDGAETEFTHNSAVFAPARAR
jgi:peptidoglycan/LPS O-acetylase OafA/YrhL